MALVDLSYVDSAGAPALIGGGRAEAKESVSGILRARIYTQAAGVSNEFLAVPSRIDLTFIIDVDTGSDIYLNRVTFREMRTGTYACDEKPVLTVTIPDAGSRARITGNANLVGEIELPTEGYLELLGRPVIKATGPAGNQRYATLAAEAPAPDATRPWRRRIQCWRRARCRRRSGCRRCARDDSGDTSAISRSLALPSSQAAGRHCEAWCAHRTTTRTWPASRTRLVRRR